MSDAANAWPPVRLRRLADKRSLMRRTPICEVEQGYPDAAPTREVTRDPVGSLTALGLASVDATGMMRQATAAGDGSHGGWVGLPEGHRARAQDIPRVHIRRLPDVGGRERYEVRVDAGPIEAHDRDSLWDRVRRWAHPADDAPAHNAWDDLYARGDHTTWVDYVSGGLVEEDPPAAHGPRGPRPL